MRLNEISLTKYKAPLIYSLFLIFGGISLYFLIIIKIIDISTLKDDTEKARFKEKKMEKSITVLKRNLKELKEEYIEQKQEQVENAKRKNMNSFANLGEFESFISEEMATNYITLITIARAESIKGSDKVYVPYAFNGTYKNIESFIEELENSSKTITFSDTPFKLQKKENWMFNGKLATNILNQQSVCAVPEDSKLNYNKVSTKKITGITVFLFNNKKYAILKFADGTSKYLSESDKITWKGEKYRVKIINTNVFLEK